MIAVVADKDRVKSLKLVLIAVGSLTIAVFSTLFHEKPKPVKPPANHPAVHAVAFADESWQPVIDPAEVPLALAAHPPSKPHHSRR